MATFQSYGRPLSRISSCKYLDRVLMSADDDWAVVILNPMKAWKRWTWISWILGRKGGNAKLSMMVYKAVVQAVFL